MLEDMTEAILKLYEKGGEMDWQEEADRIFARLQQIAPRAVGLYRRPVCKSEMPDYRLMLAHWERENDKIMASLKRMTGIKDKP